MVGVRIFRDFKVNFCYKSSRMYKFDFIEKNEIKLILNKHEFEKDLSENR
jgi:hypothetical protein